LIVLDSSFLVAYLNENDAHHGAAAAIMQALIEGRWGRALLPEYVFLEVVTVLMVRRDSTLASRAARTLLQAREVDFVPCSEIFEATLDVFLDQCDTRLSFTDAAIVGIARQHPPGLIATFDRGFDEVPGATVVRGPEAA